MLCTPLADGCVPLTAAAYGGNSLRFSLAFTAHSGVLSPSQVAREIWQLQQHLLQLLLAGGSRAVVSGLPQLKRNESCGEILISQRFKRGTFSWFYGGIADGPAAEEVGSAGTKRDWSTCR